MSNEPSGLFAGLSRLIWSALALAIALWCTVQLLLQIWIYIAIVVTIIVIAYIAFAVFKLRRWGP